MGSRRLRAARAGEFGSRGASRSLAGAQSTHRRRPGARRRPSWAHLQRRSRARSADSSRQRAAAWSSTCGSGRRRDHRRSGHGLRRPGLARGHSRLPRGHSRRPHDASARRRGDHRELPRDRRPLAAARGHAQAGGRARGGARWRVSLLPRDAALVAVDRGRRRRDGRGRHHPGGRPRSRPALQRPVGGQVPAAGRRRPRPAPRVDRVRAHSQLSRRARVDRRVRRPGGRRALALARSRARRRPRHLHRPQPARARPRERGSVRSAVPGDRAARSGTRGARRRALVVELPVRGADSRAVGGARPRRAPSRTERARRVQTSSSSRSASSPTTWSSSSTSTSRRKPWRTSSGCGSSARQR